MTQPMGERVGLAGPLGPFLYILSRSAASAFFTFFLRRRVIGRENIPAEGGVVIAANHASLADPPLVGSSMSRPLYFMAKQELFDSPLFGWFIKQLNAFPIRRMERDIGAFRMAQRVLQSGGGLILFPEGTRQKGGKLGAARPGVGMLAIRAGVPVVPVYVHNSENAARFGRVAVIFGAPLSSEGWTDYQAFSNHVMAAIQALKEKHFGS